MSLEADTVLCRYGEIGLKSTKVRTDMERRLRDNIEALLSDRGVDGTVERRWSRLLVHTDEPDAALDAATDAFGVVSASPAATRPPTLDAIRGALREAAESHPGGSFAVRARRAGPKDAHPFASGDIEREGGRVVGEVSGAPVDLDDPDVTYGVDCRKEEAFVFTETRPGPGGLPLGSQGTAVVLLSGGIDSPVAAWEAMKRGCTIAPVYVDLGDYGGPDHRARAVSVGCRLARYAPNYDAVLRVVPAGDLVGELAAEIGHTRMLSLRRVMLRTAEEVAREVGAHSIVTGESLGQKSSQTGPNLAVTDAAVTLPVHRPLLTRDKTDITDAARRIGTFDDSTLPVGCERVAPTHPETNATLSAVEAAEPADLFERAAALAAEAETVDLHELRRQSAPIAGGE
ncbi:tRNA uracil 4-sulfurtransferase ThiI [Halegenticoccus soli]|uniref:tRNA uracil 4-sulfurtransferase ThiI n=1 Tax=Halegenticoccus soli TaxID=1985678 RepID=UPI00117B4712|nr:tRNA uracil 4-sulfurtransferase ThiI [Halegenticoccus soli]